MPGGRGSAGRWRHLRRWLRRGSDHRAWSGGEHAGRRQDGVEDLSAEERFARLEARLARIETLLLHDRQSGQDGQGRQDDERLDDFLVLVAAAFESLALGSERLRFNNPR